MNTPITVSPVDIRRLFITRQRLAGPRPAPTAEGLLELTRDLGCIQLDPTSAVARTNLLVPWSRIGQYDPAIFDRLLWQDHSLFEYWAHAASIVPTEDYPIHLAHMMRYRSGKRRWGMRVQEWMSKNQDVVDAVMTALKEREYVTSADFDAKKAVGWTSSGWNNDRKVSMVLDFLWTQGIILVSGRKGSQRRWSQAERVLPEWTPREELPEHEVVRRSAEKSLRTLGIARQADIVRNYVRDRYDGLPAILNELEAEKRIMRVEITGDEADDKKWRGPWYIHADDLALLERIQVGDWEGRTTLLSPFDNLICDRARTELLFDFEFRIEIYVPKEKRKYGYYVLPILHDDRLIGRIDPLMDRKAGRLNINAVYAEPDAPLDRKTGRAVTNAIQELATFLGAKDIAYTERMPSGWQAGES
jgi:uncharacterized protein YcaQ